MLYVQKLKMTKQTKCSKVVSGLYLH